MTISILSHFFCFDVALVKEKWHLVNVLASLSVSISMPKFYQNIPNGISAISFSLTYHGRRDGQTDSQGDYRARFESTFNRSTFLWVVQHFETVLNFLFRPFSVRCTSLCCVVAWQSEVQIINMFVNI